MTLGNDVFRIYGFAYIYIETSRTGMGADEF